MNMRRFDMKGGDCKDQGGDFRPSYEHSWRLVLDKRARAP